MKLGIIIVANWFLRKRTLMLSIDDLFKGRHFDREMIILCVRWYLRFKLSFRHPVEMMAERGVSLAHTTIMRWIQRYVPEFEKRWNRFACRSGASWRVDETDVKTRCPSRASGGFRFAAGDRYPLCGGSGRTAQSGYALHPLAPRAVGRV
jgi:hypothetical protein